MYEESCRCSETGINLCRKIVPGIKRKRKNISALTSTKGTTETWKTELLKRRGVGSQQCWDHPQQQPLERILWGLWPEDGNTTKRGMTTEKIFIYTFYGNTRTCISIWWETAYISFKLRHKYENIHHN